MFGSGAHPSATPSRFARLNSGTLSSAIRGRYAQRHCGTRTTRPQRTCRERAGTRMHTGRDGTGQRYAYVRHSHAAGISRALPNNRTNISLSAISAAFLPQACVACLSTSALYWSVRFRPSLVATAKVQEWRQFIVSPGMDERIRDDGQAIAYGRVLFRFPRQDLDPVQFIIFAFACKGSLNFQELAHTRLASSRHNRTCLLYTSPSPRD